MRTDFSEVKSVFGFRVRLLNPKSRSQNLNPDFPIERNLLNACILVPTVFRWHKQMNSNFILFFVFLRPCKMEFHFHFYFSFFVYLWHWKTDLNFVFRFSFSPHFEKGIWISVFVFRFLITLKNGFEFRFSCFVFASLWKTDFNFVFRICIAHCLLSSTHSHWKTDWSFLHELEKWISTPAIWNSTHPSP